MDVATLKRCLETKLFDSNYIMIGTKRANEVPSVTG